MVGKRQKNKKKTTTEKPNYGSLQWVISTRLFVNKTFFFVKDSQETREESFSFTVDFLYS